MNKGIIFGALLVILTVVGAGAYFLLVHRPNQPTVRYVQVELVARLPEEDQNRLLESWQELVANDQVMAGLVQHKKTASKWGMSEEKVIQELRDRFHLKSNKKTGLQVGFSGKRKETDYLNELSQSLFQAGTQLLMKNDARWAEVFKVK